MVALPKQKLNSWSLFQIAHIKNNKELSPSVFVSKTRVMSLLDVDRTQTCHTEPVIMLVLFRPWKLQGVIGPTLVDSEKWALGRNIDCKVDSST